MSNLKKRRASNRFNLKKRNKSQRPRLSVYRSNKHFSAQLIDDLTSRTIASYSSINLKDADTLSKSEIASKVGSEIASRILSLSIKNICFDRGGYIYHGRVKEFAQSARASGLVF